MYESYWQLTRQPVLLKLRYLVENRKGLGLLAGAGGTGKTLLARMLVEQLADTQGPFVHLVFPRLAPQEILAYLAVQLGADPKLVGSDQGGLDRTILEIERVLAGFDEKQKHPVVFIDEAHLIEDVAVFQALRLLLNLLPQQRTPLSLLFVGQPELINIIRRIGPLEERLAFSCILRPLTFEETEGYVMHRIEAAGNRRRIFSQDALESLFELSSGIPRRINRICDLALLVGYADDATTIGAEQIEAVCEELTTAVAD
jgi:type II secretory pathway predicted ATPase ExeA